MKEIQKAPPSAVAIIETDDHFLLEGRPNIKGSLAYAGKHQLFGGHINDKESPLEAINRELSEELGLGLPEDPELLCQNEVASQLKDGSPALRNVSLFYVRLRGVDDLAMKVPGEIIRIGKTLEDLERHAEMLTQFAYRALANFIENRRSTEGV